jgi:hypothetical protein
MPSHFSTIGLPFASNEQLGGLLESLIEHTETLGWRKGGWNEFNRYHRWSSNCGAELWIQVASNNEIIGVNPHFVGESTVRVGLTAKVSRPGESGGDGAFHGWAQPTGDDPDSGCYPFVFDAPDFCCHENIAMPSIANAQIAAFAHELTIFSSEEEYDASQTGEMKFASQSFIPSGLFSPSGESTQPPQAQAVFTGHILKTEYRTNEVSGVRFLWAKVETLGGVYDVVADCELVTTTPVVGGILSGAFWLTGRLARSGDADDRTSASPRGSRRTRRSR